MNTREITTFDPPLDEEIQQVVELLNEMKIETYESCQGGKGHSYKEPTVRFHGDRSEGFRALAIVLQHDFPVSSLNRMWNIIDGEPTGPTWELVF